MSVEKSGGGGIAGRAPRRRRRKPEDRPPKKLPPYAVVVFNDDLHTFQYVVETFIKVFGYPLEKGYSLAVEIHNCGRGIVWSGSKELAELKRDQIRSAGPDFYAAREGRFSPGRDHRAAAGVKCSHSLAAKKRSTMDLWIAFHVPADSPVQEPCGLFQCYFKLRR